ncbi:MAG: hypothetical protein JJ901_10585 [Erythrobacter sp.]|uniref:hypothetical protein n=1 Tax=Erythrobacter sp. TaxID=1042 RepID=UPI001B1EF24E|nr:hypothetical protein [Erythrobacter sp.]MBO6768730.1 hypothetical protein [Erythrobacter sp.]
MKGALTAGVAYWALIFGLGFILGTVRVLWLAPRVGETVAGLIEMPIILGASWLVARWLVGRFEIRRRGEALAMGGVAFALLMVAELALGVAVFAMSPAQWLASISQPPGLYGLIGQVAFGMMPLCITRRVR